MRKPLRSLATLVAVEVFLAGAGPVIAAPAQLYGRSVTVTWTEEREQRLVGEEGLNSVARSAEFSVYLSSTGRPFSRMSFSFRGRSGARDAVGGESRRSVNFQGHELKVVMPMAGGARLVSVTFDSGFQSCSARVLTGKPNGSQKIRVTSSITGREIEIVSVRSGAASCRVQDGNVFAE
jgi:hypothetical protein